MDSVVALIEFDSEEFLALLGMALDRAVRKANTIHLDHDIDNLAGDPETPEKKTHCRSDLHYIRRRANNDNCTAMHVPSHQRTRRRLEFRPPLADKHAPVKTVKTVWHLPAGGTDVVVAELHNSRMP